MNDLYKFLYFGYTFDKDNLSLPWSFDVNEKLKDYPDLSGYSYDDLVKEGVKVFTETFRRLSSKGVAPNLLPLSGGLDSRAILGGLFESVSASEIKTVSYGLPGSMDFEIPKRIAKEFGISHDAIDLSPEKFIWEEGKLVEHARKIGRSLPIFETYINHLIPEIYGYGYNYWSGFMGDPISGSHIDYYDNTSHVSVVSSFLKKNSYPSKNLLPQEVSRNLKDSLPKSFPLDGKFLTYGEQLDFMVRQNEFIKDTVMNRNYSYTLPFLEPEIVIFFLRCPNQYLKDQRLYKDILKEKWPKLYSIPTKNNRGANLFDGKFLSKAKRFPVRFKGMVYKKFGLNTSLPMLNYQNFNEDLRRDTSIRDIVYRNLKSFKNRGIIYWLNVDDMWESHMKRRGNLSNDLMLLASLEINIKAGNIDL